MNEYKVEFSCKKANGGRITEQDTTTSSTAQEAVDRVREWYGDLVGFRIEKVWICRNNRWEVVEAGERETPPPREVLIQRKWKSTSRNAPPEFLTRAVESAAKRGFAVEYKAVSTLKAPDCYDCGFCHRLRYLRSEWHCRVFKPDEVPNPCTLYHSRTQAPNCLECESWCLNDPRCMNPRSQWAGLTTSPDNYCRFFERRPPEK